MTAEVIRGIQILPGDHGQRTLNLDGLEHFIAIYFHCWKKLEERKINSTEYIWEEYSHIFPKDTKYTRKNGTR